MKYYVPGAKEELTVDIERTVLHLLQKQVVSHLQAGAVCIRYPIPDLRQNFSAEMGPKKLVINFNLRNK